MVPPPLAAGSCPPSGSLQSDLVSKALPACLEREHLLGALMRRRKRSQGERPMPDVTHFVGIDVARCASQAIKEHCR